MNTTQLALSRLDATRVRRGQLNRFLVRAADGLYIEGDFACFLDAARLANELGAAGAAAVIVDACLIESDESDGGVVWRY